jgi:hypothetical protein
MVTPGAGWVEIWRFPVLANAGGHRHVQRGAEGP